MEQFGAFERSAQYFWQTNANGTVLSFDSNDRDIPWQGSDTCQPPYQAVQPILGTIGLHFNPVVMNPNHNNGVSIQRGSPSISDATHSVHPSGRGFTRPSPQQHITFPFHTLHNTPDPPWSHGAPSSISTSTSLVNPNSTPNNASPGGNGTNVIPDTNTSTHSSPGAGTNTIAVANSPENLGGHARFTCPLCSFFSKTRRDFDRHLITRAHLRKHGEETVKRFHCAVRYCRYASGKGFTRMDNLRRHERNKHTSRCDEPLQAQEYYRWDRTIE